jgi:N6-adenosine-specific RNA methylase IME4
MNIIVDLLAVELGFGPHWAPRRPPAGATCIPADLPFGKFGTILADPPWPYTTYSVRGQGRSASAHYDVMSLDDIRALPVGRWAAPDCVLLLWVTKPQLVHAPTIISDWGFTYKTIGFTWVKGRIEPTGPPIFSYGLGHWTRSNPELCLLATRGRPRRLHGDVAELILAPRREHSRKPDEIYGRIERLVAGAFSSCSPLPRPPTGGGWTRWIGKDRAPNRRWKSDSYPGAETDPPPEAA